MHGGAHRMSCRFSVRRKQRSEVDRNYASVKQRCSPFFPEIISGKRHKMEAGPPSSVLEELKIRKQHDALKGC